MADERSSSTRPRQGRREPANDWKRLIAEGMSLPEIAHRLGIGQTTARTHLTRLFDKFERRTQLALALRLDALLKTDG